MIIHPTITIGITCHNAEDTIARALRSAVDQDWDQKEIIIFDDYSQDSSRNIIKNFCDSHPYARPIFSDKNRGVAYARNRVIQEAQGEFLAFFDDDDVSDKSRIRLQYQQILAYETEHPHTTVLSHTARRQIFPDQSHKLEPAFSTVTKQHKLNCTEIALGILTGRLDPSLVGSAATCSQMARISLYRQLGGFDENFRRVEDTELAVRAALQGHHFISLNSPLVTQTMTLSPDKQLSNELHFNLLLLEKHKNFIVKSGSNRVYLFSKSWIELKHDLLSRRNFKFFTKLFLLCISHPMLTARRIRLGWQNKNSNLKTRKMRNEK